MPTPAQLSGDFSALLQGANPIQLYNPFTTRPDPANPGLFIRDPFPNNDISSVLNPGAVSLAQAVFPAPQPVVNGFNGYDLRSNLTPQNQYSFRVDHNFNPSNSVFFRYTSSDETRVGTGGIVGETATAKRSESNTYCPTTTSSTRQQSWMRNSDMWTSRITLATPMTI